MPRAAPFVATPGDGTPIIRDRCPDFLMVRRRSSVETRRVRVVLDEAVVVFFRFEADARRTHNTHAFVRACSTRARVSRRMSQQGRYSLASSAAAAVMAGAANFAPPGGMASPNVYSPRGVAPPTTVQQTRTRGAAAASYYDYGDDDDFRYNEEGATASGVGRWPTFSLGSVILCVLIAMAVALGTNVRALTVVPADADARALAARVTAVGQSVDVMAQALAAEAKAAAKAGGAKAARAHARDLSALKDDVGKLAEVKSQEDAVARVQKNAEKKPAPKSTGAADFRSFRRSSSRWRR